MLYQEFYAAQGNPGFYNEEREQEREFDLMKSYYPDTARKIQEKAEAQCQLLDYEGSRLYDECPDRFMLYHICSQVKEEISSDTSAQEMPGSFLDDRSTSLPGDFQKTVQTAQMQTVSSVMTDSANICPYTGK